MPDEHKNELDTLLDQALASYVDQEPDPALRTRILARAAEAEPSPKRLWLLAPAAICAAAFLIVLLLHPAMRSPRPVPAAEPAIASVSQSPAAVPATPRQMIRPPAVLTARRTRRSEHAAPARTSSFPSPSPLTAEESILLNFAASHPEQARQVLTSAAVNRAPPDTKPLSIEPIHIAALSEPQETQHLQ
jgi:hypothetical protein